MYHLALLLCVDNLCSTESLAQLQPCLLLSLRIKNGCTDPLKVLYSGSSIVLFPLNMEYRTLPCPLTPLQQKPLLLLSDALVFLVFVLKLCNMGVCEEAVGSYTLAAWLKFVLCDACKQGASSGGYRAGLELLGLCPCAGPQFRAVTVC